MSRSQERKGHSPRNSDRQSPRNSDRSHGKNSLNHSHSHGNHEHRAPERGFKSMSFDLTGSSKMLEDFADHELVANPCTPVANFFSEWDNLKWLLIYTWVWILISMGISSDQVTNDAGKWSDIKCASDGSAECLGSIDDFCDSSPYYYLRPFGFEFTQSSTNISVQSGDEVTRCGWPGQNSSFRMVTIVFTFILLPIMYFDTPVAKFGNIILALFTFFYFGCFLLDANSAVIGYYECDGSFENSQFNEDMLTNGISLTCYQSYYNGTVVIDLMLAVQFWMLFLGWSNCHDLHGITDPSKMKRQTIGKDDEDDIEANDREFDNVAPRQGNHHHHHKPQKKSNQMYDEVSEEGSGSDVEAEYIEDLQVDTRHHHHKSPTSNHGASRNAPPSAQRQRSPQDERKGGSEHSREEEGDEEEEASAEEGSYEEEASQRSDEEGGSVASSEDYDDRN